MAGRNIVVCLDGTGNQFHENNTNVVKLFRVLKRDPKRQMVYYDPGVGTLADPDYKTSVAKKINRARGLAFGAGLKRNIGEAYGYLMDVYQPEDRILLFGFSRGAYSARALAGLIHACGLIDRGCQNLIPYAMKLFAARPVDFRVLQKFKSTYGREVPVHFLGLWDSVSTLGWIYDPVFMPFTTNNPSVETVRHALAIDERRAFFQPVLWGDRHADKQDIKEVWFAGVHSDVGGGYPERESGLAKIALDWMIREAGTHGLVVAQQKYKRYVLGRVTGNARSSPEYVGPAPEAEGHVSLTRGWKLVQKLPARVWSWDEQRKVLKVPPDQRAIEAGSTLHRSVLERIDSPLVDYTPSNLDGDTDALQATYDIEEG